MVQARARVSSAATSVAAHHKAAPLVWWAAMSQAFAINHKVQTAAVQPGSSTHSLIGLSDVQRLPLLVSSVASIVCAFSNLRIIVGAKYAEVPILLSTIATDATSQISRTFPACCHAMYAWISARRAVAGDMKGQNRRAARAWPESPNPWSEPAF